MSSLTSQIFELASVCFFLVAPSEPFFPFAKASIYFRYCLWLNLKGRSPPAVLLSLRLRLAGSVVTFPLLFLLCHSSAAHHAPLDPIVVDRHIRAVSCEMLSLAFVTDASLCAPFILFPCLQDVLAFVCPFQSFSFMFFRRDRDCPRFTLEPLKGRSTSLQPQHTRIRYSAVSSKYEPICQVSHNHFPIPSHSTQ